MSFKDGLLQLSLESHFRGRLVAELNVYYHLQYRRE